uniref:Beta-1,4-mannosyltransferase n=2 Tax=Arcella intermedia TaxID=1963864 RepID=A0A6B2L8L3_9EUKA
MGEIARSPRMQYHAVSLANQASYNVDLVGFSGGECWPEITSNPKIQQHYIQPVQVPTSIANIYVLEKLYKVFFQIFYLFWTLMTIPRPDFILVQTPPAIPILHIAILVSWFRWCKLVIDWHNYGFTILQVSGKANWIVSLYYFYESFFGRFANYHFCVSNTMKEDIRNKWNINAIVLYDRPPEIFKPASLVSQHKLFLKQKFGKTPNPLLNAGSSVTAFTKKEHREIEIRKDRPVLIVSSTSWTADEDFEILFSAMRIIDNYIKGKFQIRLVITGKGDMRAHYEAIIQNLNLTHIKIYTAYLSYEDYITLLGSADIGICLHYSSSGVDLPMKIVDMYGCHLPTLAYSYKA